MCVECVVSSQIMSDVLFVTETAREAKRLNTAGHNVWLYKFEHSTPLFDHFRRVWRHLYTKSYHKLVPHGTDVTFAYMPQYQWPVDKVGSRWCCGPISPHFS